MKSMRIKKQEKESKSWILPGTIISQDEFMEGIRQSEKEPFHTVQESMENFELWVKSREKK